MYIESGKVKFYPSAYRQYQENGETKNINPESELNTEYNITSHIAKLLKKNKGSFIVNYVENNNLEFYLGGYYIHITSPQDILNAFPNATQIWANMKVAPFTPTDNTKGFSELYEVVDYDDSGKNIDEINNNVVSFKGVAFLDTKDSNATFSLQLFTRKDTKSSWEVYEPSNYVLDSSEIGNTNDATGEDISQRFDTLTLYATTLHTELGHVNDTLITNVLNVKGGALFENQVRLNNNLFPTNNNQVNIGSSDKEFANIYVNKITGVSEVDNGQNAITLKSNIVPSGNVTLGSIDNKITNIYVNDISCTNEIVVNDVDAVNGNIDYATINSNLDVVGDATFETSVEFAGDLLPVSGSQIDIGLSSNPIANVYAENLTATKINLKSQIIPDGTVTLGSANNLITNIYATNIYGTNLKDVNEIDGGQSSISLKSDIYPDGQVDLGGPSNKFNQIYANETISDGLEALSLKVNDINSGASNITLYKTILPMSTGSISFGNNTFKFNEIYANKFYGALTGNASTATKLNQTGSVGNQTGAVYFNKGVPVATDYNSANFNAIKNLHNFSFTSLPQVGSAANPMDITVGGGYANNCLIFVTIDFGSYTDTVPFIRKQFDNYSYNNCNSPSYMFRLSFSDTELSTIPYFKTTVTLQYKNTGSWSKAPFNILNIFALQFPNITTTN